MTATITPLSTVLPVEPDLPASAMLRAATRIDHEAVDGAYGSFAIRTAEGYARFLLAHASILPRAERLIDPAGLIDGWSGRTAPLLADLAALGAPTPAETAFALPEGQAARWGALYVLEGSRLGGAVLSREVPRGLPSAYLGSRHAPGAWRGLLAALDAAEGGGSWRREAIAGAKAMFAGFLDAARLQAGA